MKPARLRPQAKRDLADEVRYHRREAGPVVAGRLRSGFQQALEQLERNPGIGSPVLGIALQLAGLRTWRIQGFPLSVWYFECEDHLDIARLVGHRQDAMPIEVGDAQ